MKRWLKAFGTFAVTMTHAGCAPVVLDPVQQAPAAEASDGGSDAAPAATSPSFIAILAKDLPPPPTGPQGSIGVDGAGLDPGSLVLMFSNQPEPCAAPQIGGVCSAQTEWQGSLILPADLVRVGLVDLANPRIAAYSFIYYDPTCSGGGGGGAPPGGALEIVSLDPGSITVNLIDGLTGSQASVVNGVPVPGVTLKGTYVAPRCEPAPAPPPPGAALAILGANLPAGLASSPTIGANPDPTALYVFLGSGPEACADPLSPLGCAGAARVVLRLPAALQKPGTLDLGDPQLAASVALAVDDGTPNCTAPSAGSFMQGTMTLHSVDASGVSFTLYQSLTSSPSGVQFDADGLYQATLCP